MNLLHKYFDKRKEASKWHKLIYSIREAQESCSWLFKTEEEHKKNCEKFGIGIMKIREYVDSDFENWSSDEKEEWKNAGLLDIDCGSLEWSYKLQKFAKKQLKGKIPMICFQGICISIWEIPILIVAVAPPFIF